MLYPNLIHLTTLELSLFHVQQLYPAPLHKQEAVAQHCLGTYALTLLDSGVIVAGVNVHAPMLDSIRDGYIAHTNYLVVKPAYAGAAKQLVRLAKHLAKDNDADWITFTRQYTENSYITRYYKL